MRIHDGYGTLAPVTALSPNPFGLHHVHGNVAEWCRDPFLRVSTAQFELNEGDGLLRIPDLGARAIRGGSFITPPSQAYSAVRRGRSADAKAMGVGVRVARRVQN